MPDVIPLVIYHMHSVAYEHKWLWQSQKSHMLSCQLFVSKLKACCVLQAGSDSLLTSSAFVKLASSRFKGFEQLQGHKGVLFGLGVDGNNEMVLTDH